MRWREYWKIEFPETALSRELSGYLNLTEAACDFPEVLVAKLEKAHGRSKEAIVLVLKNLSRPPPGF